MKYMTPNHLRPTLGQQRFIVRCINVLGYNPFRKPIHHYTKDELREITRMYREVTECEQIRHSRNVHMAR